jgi:hypothetical protein
MTKSGSALVPSNANKELTSHVVEELVFIAVHCCWPDDGGVREDILNPFFALKLGAIVDGRGVWRGIQVGKVHEALNTRLRSDLCYPFRTSDMDVGILEVPV